MKRRKIVVVDTNVIFSAVYNIHSNAGKLILSGIGGKIQLIAPEIAKKELQDVLQKKLGFSADECNDFIKSLPIEWVPESVYAPLLDIEQVNLSKVQILTS